MLNDEDLSGLVERAIRKDERVYLQPIDISVDDGIVTLTGTVRSHRRKLVAYEIASSFEGCRDVVNKLAVDPEAPLPDMEVANNVVSSLNVSADIAPDAITVAVTDGVASLSGAVTMRNITAQFKSTILSAACLMLRRAGSGGIQSLPLVAASSMGLGILVAKPLPETGVIATRGAPLGIADLTVGIIVALVLGGFLLILKYGKQCSENVIWFRDVLRMNLGRGTDEKRKKSNVECSIEESSSEEIVEIKNQISRSSQQIRAILAEILQIINTTGERALEDNVEAASTQYAMKFELKRPEFEKAMRALKTTLAEIPEEGVVDRQKVNEWIAKAQKKFEDYSPVNFGDNL
jgi:hypothetical protein